MLYNLISWR